MIFVTKQRDFSAGLTVLSYCKVCHQLRLDRNLDKLMIYNTNRITQENERNEARAVKLASRAKLAYFPPDFVNKCANLQKYTCIFTHHGMLLFLLLTEDK